MTGLMLLKYTQSVFAFDHLVLVQVSARKAKTDK